MVLGYQTSLSLPALSLPALRWCLSTPLSPCSPSPPGSPYLPGVVVLHLPAAGQLQLLVGEQVEEGHQVAVVLVALKVVSVAPHLADHVLQTRVARKHAVGTLWDTTTEETQ